MNVVSCPLLVRICFVLFLTSFTSFANNPNFHPPQTNAEKALNEIFNAELYINNKAVEHGYITQKLYNTLKKVETNRLNGFCKDLVQLEGDPPCEMLSYDPIVCGQDVPPDGYLVKTVYLTNNKTVIIQRKDWIVDGKVMQEFDWKHTYTLRKQNDKWKLDETSCLNKELNLPSSTIYHNGK